MMITILINCMSIFFRELKLLQYRVKIGQEEQFSSWIQNLG